MFGIRKDWNLVANDLLQFTSPQYSFGLLWFYFPMGALRWSYPFIWASIPPRTHHTLPHAKYRQFIHTDSSITWLTVEASAELQHAQDPDCRSPATGLMLTVLGRTRGARTASAFQDFLTLRTPQIYSAGARKLPGHLGNAHRL